MDSGEILQAIKRVLSRAERPLSVREIGKQIADPKVTSRQLNPVLAQGKADGEFVSQLLTLPEPGCEVGTVWKCWSLSEKADPIELGYTYDWGAWETDDPAGMSWADVTLDGIAVENVVRCRSGVDGFVDAISVTGDGPYVMDEPERLRREVKMGRVEVRRRDTPP